MDRPPLQPANPPGETREERKHAFAFYLGVVLIALSHAIFAAYAAIPFLGMSPAAMGATFLAGSVASWVVFGVGVWLAGKEGFALLKGLLARPRPKSGAPDR